jgi:hypothetical protein
MEDAGFTSSDFTLTSGRTTGSLTINKTTETPEDVLVQVTAPLRNDDYNLTFTCPTRKVRDNGTLPTPTGTGLAYNVPAFVSSNNGTYTITINGTVAVSNKVGTDGSVYTPVQYGFVITDNPQIGNYKTVLSNLSVGTTFIDKSTYLSDGWNDITVQMTTNQFFSDSQQFFSVERGGIFHDGSNWGWATQSTSSIYDHTHSPEADGGVYSHFGAPFWSTDHRRKVARFRWYEESGSSTGFFDETFNWEIYDTQNNLVYSRQDALT